MAMPEPDDIAVGDCLDTNTARAHFSGKSVSDARKMFARLGAYYLEDLCVMTPSAFMYYLPALIDYIDSDDTRAAFEIPGWVAAALQNQLRLHANELKSAREDLVALCKLTLRRIGEPDLAEYDFEREREILTALMMRLGR